MGLRSFLASPTTNTHDQQKLVAIKQCYFFERLQNIIIWCCLSMMKTRRITFQCKLWALLLVSSVFIIGTYANESDRTTQPISYYIDSSIGQDTNNGTIEAPFATISAIQNLINETSGPSDVIIYLAPGNYPIRKFYIYDNQFFSFLTCTLCPQGTKPTGRASILVSLDPTSADQGTFFDQSTSSFPGRIRLSFENIDFRPETNSTFDYPIFYVRQCGLRLIQCLVEGFSLYYEAKFVGSNAHGIVVTSYASVEYIRSVMRNNHATVNKQASSVVLTGPLFGGSFLERVVVSESRFEFNSISGNIILGGLLYSQHQMSVYNSSFISNSGYASISGAGMAIQANLGSHLEVRTSRFESNQFFIIPTNMNQSMDGQLLGFSHGGAISMVPETVLFKPGEPGLFVEDTVFIANLATEGGAISIGDYEMPGQSTSTPKSDFEISINKTLFQHNNATSGVGAAWTIQGTHINSVHISDVIFDANGMAPGPARKMYPGLPPSQGSPIDPSAAFFLDLRFASIIATDWTFRCGANLTRPHLVHRVMVLNVLTLNVQSLAYENIELHHESSSAALFEIQDVETTSFSHVQLLQVALPALHLLEKHRLRPLFSCDSTRNGVLDVTRLTIPDWTPLESQLTFLFAQGLDRVAISDAAIRGTQSSNSPLFFIQDCGSVLFSKLNFSDFAGAIKILDSESITFTSSTFNKYRAQNPMISINNNKKSITFDSIHASDSAGPFIQISSFLSGWIRSSSFFNATVSTSGGSVQLSQGASFSLSDSDWRYIRGVSGAAISSRDVSVTVERCQFFSNIARLNGGAIQTEGASLSVSGSWFEQCKTLNGNGGAIHNSVRIVHIQSSSFIRCSASNSGGALSFDDTVISEQFLSSSVHRCNLTENFASAGGAVVIINQELEISETTFNDNRALDSHGGAALIFAQRKKHTFSLCSFVSNSALNGRGGAISITDSDWFNVAKIPLTLSQCRFTGNQALEGGALSSEGPFADFTDLNWFTSNRAKFGGAINVLTFTKLPNFSNFIFEKNSADIAGAVISFVTNAEGNLRNYLNAWLQRFNDKNRFINEPHSSSIYNTTTALFPLQVTAQILSQGTRKEFYEAPANTNLIWYPGIARSLRLQVEDLFGHSGINPNAPTLQWSTALEGCTGTQETINRIQLSHAFEFSSLDAWDITKSTVNSSDWGLEQANIGQERRWTRSSPFLGLSVLLTLSPLESGSDPILNETISCNLMIEGPKSPKFKNTPLVALSLLIQLSPCGFGSGQSLQSSSCQICPVGSYSFNGTCVSCIETPHVTCFGGVILPNRNYYVLIDMSSYQFQALRCPPGFCTPVQREEVCSPGRSGVMCGHCTFGMNESIISTCLNCNGPNWMMIAIAIAILWAAALILHSLVAVSSGKSTILIFFVQACFVMNSQIDIFSTGAKKTVHPVLNFLLCFMPLNALSRTLIIGVVPFILIIMLFITFGVRLAILKILSLISTGSVAKFDPLRSKSSFAKQNMEPAPYEGVEDEDIFSASSSMSPQIELNTDASGSETDQFEANQDEKSSWGPLIETQDESSSELLGNESLATIYQYNIQMTYWHPYRLIRTTMSLLAGSFSSILGVSISTIDCVKLIDGRRVLQSAPSISCDSRQFILFRNLNGLWIPYLIILFLGLLWKLVSIYRSRTLSATDVRFGTWYEMYKPRLFAWKLTEMIRRLVLSIVAKILMSSPLARSASLFAISIVFLATHLVAMPYRKKAENILETMSLTSLSLIALVNVWNSYLFSEANPHKGSFIFVWVAWIVVSAVIIFAILFTKVRGRFASRNPSEHVE